MEMTRKEAATIIKKYEKNGMAPLMPKKEYLIAKQRYHEIVMEEDKIRNKHVPMTPLELHALHMEYERSMGMQKHKNYVPERYT